MISSILIVSTKNNKVGGRWFDSNSSFRKKGGGVIGIIPRLKRGSPNGKALDCKPNIAGSIPALRSGGKHMECKRSVKSLS